MFVVYQNPPEYPGRYVLRRCVVHPGLVVMDPKPLAVAFMSHAAALAAVRLPIPPGLMKVSDPDPTILEAWL